MCKNTRHAPCAAVIGFFDGVHRGHAYLTARLRQLAAERALEPMVITFGEHPRTVVDPAFQPRLLMTAAEKKRCFARLGITSYVALPFDRATASMTARQFMTEVLSRQLNVRLLLTGYDTRFGHNRTEGFDDYVRYGRDCDIEVLRYEALTTDGVSISSSMIRQLLVRGDVERAAVCLGRHYSMDGTVVRGMQIGRRIGYPTANIVVGDGRKVVPADGVYAVGVNIEGRRLGGVMNIGRRPTFDGGDISMEVHVFDFAEDVYGRDMRVTFIRRLRAERKFDSGDDLARQIAKDTSEARACLATLTDND